MRLSADALHQQVRLIVSRGVDDEAGGEGPAQDIPIDTVWAGVENTGRRVLTTGGDEMQATHKVLIYHRTDIKNGNIVELDLDLPADQRRRLLVLTVGDPDNRRTWTLLTCQEGGHE